MKRGRRDNVGTTFGMGAPTIFGRAKTRPKFDAISDNCLLLAQITPEYINIKIWKASDQLQPLPHWGLKIWWTLVHKQKSYWRACWRTQLDFFRETIFRPLGGAVPSNVYTPYKLQSPKMYFKSDLGRRAASSWALPHISCCACFQTASEHLLRPWPSLTERFTEILVRHFSGPSFFNLPSRAQNFLSFLLIRRMIIYTIHCESKKLGHFFTAYNFRNIEHIFTKLGTNHVLFILSIMS